MKGLSAYVPFVFSSPAPLPLLLVKISLPPPEAHVHAVTSLQVRELLDEEIQLVESDKIVLAGFGQGGALAVHAGLSYNLPLAGILSFSGYAALPEDYPEHIAPANKGVPVVAVHGNADEVLNSMLFYTRNRQTEDLAFARSCMH